MSIREQTEGFVRSANIAIASLTVMLVMLIGPAAMLFGQTAIGEVNGTVTDPSGAVTPGATVKLINQSTRIEDRVSTNSSGYFIFINVKPGNYVLRVEVQGFKTAQVPAFNVGINQTVTEDIKLDVGEVAETVEVIAEAEMIERSTSALGAVVNERALNDLPLNGRNFTQLLAIVPGATPVSTSQNRSVGCCEGNVGIPNSGFSDPSFSGQSNRSKLYFFDGIINTNIRGPTYIVIPNLDLIQEFKVVSHDPKAEFGGASGGVANIVSKSGGNSFHGSAFEYVRNDAFDARNTLKDFDSLTGKPTTFPFRQNQFGATFGGPIIKNKTFFSGGYDGWRYSKADQQLSYVPTAAELSGDFSQTTVVNKRIFNPFSTRPSGTGFARDRFRCDSSGNPLPTNASRQQDQAIGIPCDKIPAALISTPMQRFLQQYSATPNLAADPGHNFIQNRPTTNNSNSFQVRVDHRFRDSDNVFLRYTEERVTVFNPIGEVGFTEGGSQGRNYGGGWLHAFRPNLILDVRAGYAGRPAVDAGQQNQHPLGLDPMKQVGLKDIDKFQGMLVNATGPGNTEWTNGGNNSFGTRGPAPRGNPNWSITPNLSWIKGNHNLKGGFWFIRAKRIQANTFQTYNFADDQTGDPTGRTGQSGLSLASALLGLPTSFQGQLPILGGGPVQFKYAAWATYVQDEWKLRPRLTLSLGLRFDALTQPQTTDGRLWNALDIPNQRWIIGAATMPPLCSVAQKAPCIPDAFRQDAHFNNVVLAGKPFFAPRPVRDNWGPRIGVAWSVTQNTVLRAGYGLYWDAVPARSQYAQNDLELAVWPDATAFSGNVNTVSSFVSGTQKFITDIQGNFPTPLPPTNPWTPFNSFGDDPNYKDAYSHQWNFEIQRQMTPNLMISAAYVGSVNRRLPYTGLANAARQASPAGTPNAQIDALRAMPWVNANITYSQSIGYSHYNALAAKIQRRFANGLQSLLSYTWGKSTDVSSGYFNVENGSGGGSTVQNYYDQTTARGVSGYDITHFLAWSTVYELPAGRGKRWLQSGPASWILGNWQLNYILSARSGQPYNLQVSGDAANLQGSAANIGTYARPNIIADPFQAGPVPANSDSKCQRTISNGGRAADQVRTARTWFNPCAFDLPSGSFGNFGRNVLRGPAVFNMDLSLLKNIPLPREGWNLQLRFESLNAFNVQNLDVPGGVGASGGAGTTIGNANAGQITGLATQPRQMQFGLRFVF